MVGLVSREHYEKRTQMWLVAQQPPLILDVLGKLMHIHVHYYTPSFFTSLHICFIIIITNYAATFSADHVTATTTYSMILTFNLISYRRSSTNL